MKRMLCIVSSMDRGGAETFLMKIYRCLYKNEYQMDFCVSKKEKGFYDEEILSQGGKIFYVPPKSKNPFKTFIEIKKIVKSENYNYVLRTSQQSLAALDLLAAKLGGAKVLIYRSSNAGMTGNKINKIINKFFSFLPKIIPNVKIAPSTEAAEFVFGKNAVKKGKVKIIHNALDYKLFKFNKNIRNRVRNELGIKDQVVLYGHIGRFNIQKNHLFLLDIFNEILKREKNSMLLLIGEGEEKIKIISKIKELKLEKSVIILKPQPNANEYLMAMDKLIFPSLFEGMPNIVIEAQATGLPCYVSSTITKEAKITNLVKYISLTEKITNWAETILNDKLITRRSYEKDFFEKKYMIEEISEEFVKECFKEVK